MHELPMPVGFGQKESVKTRRLGVKVEFPYHRKFPKVVIVAPAPKPAPSVNCEPTPPGVISTSMPPPNLFPPQALNLMPSSPGSFNENRGSPIPADTPAPIPTPNPSLNAPDESGPSGISTPSVIPFFPHPKYKPKLRTAPRNIFSCHGRYLSPKMSIAMIDLLRT